MDDAMMDPVAGDPILRRRLEAYAEARLSPELGATTRMRARVLAAAHRQAALARSAGALAVVPSAEPGARPVPAGRTGLDGTRTGRRTVRRAAVVSFAACLGLLTAFGTTLAAQPGGALYGARVWVETLSLPAAPHARVLAELDRLAARLAEAASASAAGDGEGAAAALLAYEAILGTAITDAEASGDPAALAALQTGVEQDVAVLQQLLAEVPPIARPVLDRVIEQAGERGGPPDGDGADHSIPDAPSGGGTGAPGEGPAASAEPARDGTPPPLSTPSAAPTPTTTTPPPDATTDPAPTARPDAPTPPGPTARPAPTSPSEPGTEPEATPAPAPTADAARPQPTADAARPQPTARPSPSARPTSDPTTPPAPEHSPSRPDDDPASQTGPGTIPVPGGPGGGGG